MDILRQDFSHLGCVLTLKIGDVGYVVELVRSHRFFNEQSSRWMTPNLDRAHRIYNEWREEMLSEAI